MKNETWLVAISNIGLLILDIGIRAYWIRLGAVQRCYWPWSAQPPLHRLDLDGCEADADGSCLRNQKNLDILLRLAMMAPTVAYCL